MKILDMSCGNRSIWFNKTHPMATYIDIRYNVKPDMVIDSRDMREFSDGIFDLIVFDPPHVNFGENSNMSKTYGHHTTEQIRQIIKLSAKESHRVAKPNAFMAFKWNDHDQKLPTILKLMENYWEPLFGQHMKNRGGSDAKSQSFWCLLRRLN